MGKEAAESFWLCNDTMNKLSRGIAVVMSASMVVGSTPVFADTVNSRNQYDGYTKRSYEGRQGNLTFDDGGKYVVTLKNVTIDASAGDSAIDITNGTEVVLILEGNNVLNGASNHPAIWVPSNSKLIIEGTGTLNATAGWTTIGLGAAGIGGGYGVDADFGDITINSGTVVASGSKGGAGIGGGYQTGRGIATGNITITGGYVKAINERSGAGIGAGQNDDYSGIIEISGGVVYAEGSTVGIGAGDHIGEGNHGTFSTGTNGNAVIVAPKGIGANQNSVEWDGIFVSYNSDENTAVLNGDTVTFNDPDATIQVWGTPEMDKNITVSSGTTLKVIKNDRNSVSPTLTMGESNILTNNGFINVGVDDSDTSSLVLNGGKENTAGTGVLSVIGKGTVKVPVTKGIVTVTGKDGLVYDGTAKEPNASVKLDLWEYNKTYAEDTDYTVGYDHNTDAGDNTASIIVTASGSGALLPSSYTEKFSIAKANFNPGMPTVWSVKKGEDQLLSKLPIPKNNTNPQGTLTWYSDESRQTPLTDDYVKDKNIGETIRIYGRYEHSDGNYNNPAEGYVDLKIVEFDVPDVVFEDSEIVNNAINKTYGDADKQLDVKIKIKGGQAETPKSEVEYESLNPDVASIDDSGLIKFTGAGETRIKVKVTEYNDPAGLNSYSEASATILVKVAPKNVGIASVNVDDREYNGEKSIDTKSVHASLTQGGIIAGDEEDAQLVIKSAQMDTPNAGRNAVHIDYAIEGNKAKNYKLIDEPDAMVNITKASENNPSIPAVMSGEQVIYNKKADTYNFNLNKIIPTEKIGGVTKIEVSGSTVDTSYFETKDLKVNLNTKMLSIPVKNVNSTIEDNLGEITVKITGNNFDTEGVINVTAKNTNDGGGSSSGGSGGGSYQESDIIGKDRYETAGIIADRSSVHDTVILVNANEALSDGLSAAALSGKLNAPILLTKKDSIPKATMDRLDRVSNVYIIGGENAISKKVEEQLKGKKITRIGGKDRIETSMKIAEKIGNYDEAFIVNGYTGEADAMSASAVAAREVAPIILTNGKTSNYAKKSGVEYYAVGGKAVLDDKIVSKYDAERFGGDDRYETNRLIINEFYKYSSKYYFTKGEPLVDALTVSLHAKDNGVVLVSKKSDNSILKGKDIVQVGGMPFSIFPIK